MALDSAGEKAPANVIRIDDPLGPSLPERSPELLFALLLWGELPSDRQDGIRRLLRGLAFGEHNPSAIKLHNLLSGVS